MFRRTMMAALTAALLQSTTILGHAAEEIGKIETVATFDDAMPTGVTVAPNGRIFVNYPRWGDDVPFTVAEIVNGKAVAYPDAAINKADPAHPADSLLSVQSVVVDPANRLWILDTAAPGFQTPIAGGAKMVAVDLATNKVVKTVVFPADVILPTTYVNDVRFDLREGMEGVAYLTDSSLAGPGGLIVVDLATGEAFRRLTGDRTTSADPDFVAVIDGKKMMNRPKGGTPSRFTVASDGIALSPDGETLYYSPLSSRHLYSVATAALRDRSISDADLAKQVKDLGLKGASDGLEADDQGRVYGGDYENHRIRMLEDGRWKTIAQSPQIQWPDTLSTGSDGYLYFTVNQLDRQAGFHEGNDLRKKPYKLLRIRIDAGPVALK
ncbi:L-dopachrome tautomerase-related protein [Rhizobium sp. BK251]|uniref:L-dopachrome tautomerase-related protein n=1 Tax=Rhizobium sp. BK251 TaxID=2512125 RepID=UPI001043F5F9|nr:L-dopachrome tautomerase-related protein [Rhizobium sp. BK251]TCL68235.1 sugar lactone lactonase YvrE [Rhizobium sp. BK251]